MTRARLSNLETDRWLYSAAGRDLEGGERDVVVKVHAPVRHDNLVQSHPQELLLDRTTLISIQ